RQVLRLAWHTEACDVTLRGAHGMPYCCQLPGDITRVMLRRQSDRQVKPVVHQVNDAIDGEHFEPYFGGTLLADREQAGGGEGGGGARWGRPNDAGMVTRNTPLGRSVPSAACASASSSPARSSRERSKKRCPDSVRCRRRVVRWRSRVPRWDSSSATSREV